MSEPTAHLDRRARDAEARAAVLAGLRRTPKCVPAGYLLDLHGAELFDELTRQPGYYLTNAEAELVKRYRHAIADRLGQRIVLIEPGARAGEPVRLLLGHPELVATYIGVDRQRPCLTRGLSMLRSAFPAVESRQVCADFTQPWSTPRLSTEYARAVVFMPGSAIANRTPEETVSLLRNFRNVVGAGGAVLVGLDLWKPPALMQSAYQDAGGFSARCNLNALEHLNREFSADFCLDKFTHLASCNVAQKCMEISLVSLTDQRVHIGPHTVEFAAGERMITAYAYKFVHETFGQLARSASLVVADFWTDHHSQFSIQYLVATG